MSAQDLLDLGKQVKEIRESEEKKTWAEIAADLEIGTGKVMLAYNYASVRPKDRIKDITPKQVVELRDKEKLSWGIISARSAVPESRLRKMYEDQTGNSTKGNRIGKGGRYVSGVTPPAKPAKSAPAKKASATKKATAEKAPAKKSTKKATPAKKASKEAAHAGAPKRGTVDLKSMDFGGIQERLTGKKIVRTNSKTGKGEEIRIKKVTDLTDGELTFLDDGGRQRTVKVEAITRVSR